MFIFVYYLFILACSILVPGPGTEPRSPAVKAWNPNHWTTREFCLGRRWQTMTEGKGVLGCRTGKDM